MIGRSGYPSQPSKVGDRWAIRRNFVTDPFRVHPGRADTRKVRLRATTIERVSAAYATAVAAGDFEAAEGWFAIARMVTEREGATRDRTVDKARSSVLGRSKTP